MKVICGKISHCRQVICPHKMPHERNEHTCKADYCHPQGINGCKCVDILGVDDNMDKELFEI